MRRMIPLGIGLLMLAPSALAWAQPATTESTSSQVAYGAGSVLGTLVYAPVKASFCILGAIGSGVAYPFAGADRAGKIASSTCSGTWAITPDVLKGRERVNFIATP